MALGLMGLSLGAILMPPVIASVINRYGWRATMLFLGPSFGAILSVMFAFVKAGPVSPVEQNGTEAALDFDPGAPIATRLSLADIISRRNFWVLAFFPGIAFAITQGLMVSLVPLATQVGASTMQAARVLSLLGVGAIIGKSLIAMFANRLDHVRLLAAFFAIGAAACVLPLISMNYPTLLLASFCIGAAAAMLPVLSH
jgi:Na+/melibiose symporter-like transporter